MDADDASSAEMRRLPTNRDADPLALDEDTVEQLLTGALRPGQAPPGYAEAAQLLAAAAAAPTPGELAGQEAALAELRAVARARPAAATGPASPRRRRRRTGLAVVVVVGALVTGGAAGAATGHLPGPVREAARSILGTGGATRRRPPPRTASHRRRSRETTGPGGGLPGSRPGSATSSRPGPAGPCRAARTWRGSARPSCPATAASRAGSWTRPPSRPWPVRPAARARSRPICEALQPGAQKAKELKQPARPNDEGEGQGGPPTSTGGGGTGPGRPAAVSPSPVAEPLTPRRAGSGEIIINRPL